MLTILPTSSAIHKLAKRLGLRQQVTATAILYLRRFYLRNSYCGRDTEFSAIFPGMADRYSVHYTETDVPIVAAACVYVAAKSEETAIHIKVVVTEARATFSGELVCIKKALSSH